MEEFSDADVLGITEAMMLNTARSCLETMKIVKNDQRMSYWHLPYYILGSTSLELFPKILLLRKMRKDGKSTKEIDAALRDLSHNLDCLYSEKVIGPDFLSRANVIEVKVVKQSGVFRYDFYRKESICVYVYHPESIRYGILARDRSNVGFPAWQTDNFLALCESVFTALRSTS